MTTQIFVSFLNGAIMMASVGASLFFWKFAKTTKDSFFSWFAWAFILFAIERWALLPSGGSQEATPAVYSIRCIGFLLIIIAVVRKNRKQNDSSLP